GGMSALPCSSQSRSVRVIASGHFCFLLFLMDRDSSRHVSVRMHQACRVRENSPNAVATACLFGLFGQIRAEKGDGPMSPVTLLSRYFVEADGISWKPTAFRGIE